MAIFPQRQHITDEFGEIQNDHLIGGFNPKNITQLGLLFPIYGKIKPCSKPPTSHQFGFRRKPIQVGIWTTKNT